VTDSIATPVQLTHARVLHIALPIVLSNATVPILGLVDTGVIGQMGEAAPIGAVGLGAIVLTAIYWLFGFLRMGMVGLAAQARGAGDGAEVAALLARGLMLAAAGGVVLIATQALIFAGALALAPASAEVGGMARSYMGIRIWSAPAAIGIYAITGWLIAQERTRAVLVIQVAMNGLNIGLDLLFVPVMGWGVEGVATATVIAEWSGLLLGLWFCRDALAMPAFRDWPRVLDRLRLIHLAQVNGDILIRSLLLQMVFLSFLFLAAGFGDVRLAANQVLLQFMYVTAYAMDGFAFAARANLRRAALMTGLWGLGSGVALAVCFALGGGALIDLLTTAEPVREAARAFLPWMVAVPVIGAAAWMLDGVFIGATRTGDMRNMMIVSALVYAVAAAVLVPLFGNHGLWAAFVISFVARGATLAARYPALERGAAG